MSCTKHMSTKRRDQLVPGFQHQNLTEQLNSCQDSIEQVDCVCWINTVVANLYWAS